MTSAAESVPALRSGGEGSLLELDHVSRWFRSGLGIGFGSRVHAVDDVSLTIQPGEAFGLVGESGSGKTTVARMVARLLEPSGGEIRFQGRPIARLSGRELLAYRRHVQMVFQNPFTSLNPRRRIRDVLGDVYSIHGIAHGEDMRRQMVDAMERVGLTGQMLDRFPHEFSSGQRQRIGIARALVLRPALIVADEPVAALDVSVQAQVLNLIRSLQAEFGLAILFIGHDLRAAPSLRERRPDVSVGYSRWHPVGWS